MFDIITYFLYEIQMNIIRNSKILQTHCNCMTNTNIWHKSHRNTSYHPYNKRNVSCYDNKKDKHVIADNILNENKTKSSIDKNNELYLFTTLVFTSVMVLSTCILLILSARETNMEATNFQERYDKISEKVKHLEQKNAEDEFMIGAIVDEIIKLKAIGII